MNRTTAATGMIASSLATASLLLLLCDAAVASGNAADGAAPVRVSVRNVHAARAPSGATAMISYVVDHDVTGEVEPGSRLPGARVAAADHPRAFEGAWGSDAGDISAWLAPGGGTFRFQYSPETTYISSSYYSNRLLNSDRAVALHTGDWLALAAGDFVGNNFHPFDRPKAGVPGTIGWDVAREVRTLDATYGGVKSIMDVVFLRADLVVRGGDLDATRASVNAPPLVIDLPRTYPDQTGSPYIVATVFPTTHYVSNLRLRVLPQVGKAILTPSLNGYVFEARETVLADGSVVTEWHLPLHIIIPLSVTGPAAPVGAMSLPSGGIAVVSDGRGERRLDVPAGGVVAAAPGHAGLLGDLAGAPDPVTDIGGDGSTVLPGAATAGADELEAASAIGTNLAGPVSLTAGNGRMALTIEPDFRGQGLLAVKAPQRTDTGTPYAGVLSIPYVILDGLPVRLDRSRLVELRFLPYLDGATLRFTGRDLAQPHSKVRSLQLVLPEPGFALDAVYDLGGRYGIVTFEGVAPPNRRWADGAVYANVAVIDPDGEPVDVSPVYYTEIPSNGTVAVGGTTFTRKFAAPVDLLDDDSEILEIGPREIGPTLLRSGIAGVATVVGAPAKLTPFPKTRGHPELSDLIAIYYSAPKGVTSTVSLLRVALSTDPAAPSATPPPLGSPCDGSVEVADLVSDAAGPVDVFRAWFDADAANLYASIQLAAPPVPSLAPVTYLLQWRHDHSTHYARAILTREGTWRFLHGFHNADLPAPRYSAGEEVPGEVSGNVIRMAVPRPVAEVSDGDMLRFTAAHSFSGPHESGLGTPELLVPVDTAPDGSDRIYGLGEDYTVTRCR